ncbi:MAG: DoxX family protein [Tannerella sp.]|jgi:uncharacterized membrane protein YphA (DoxX/SURF4 family)|nr:DoxX family protein [Tannerella sp.]
MKSSVNIRKTITEICRIIIGVTFIFSGLMKAIDPIGGALKMEDYFGAFSLSALKPLAVFISINLSSVEFMMGLCILAAVYRRITTFCILVFMSFMTLLTFYLAIFNPVHDCGCFGDALIITNWQTFYKNVFVLLPASVMIFINNRLMYPIYSSKVQWFITLFAYFFPTVFACYNVYHEPIKDFRPYKISNNIPQLMSFPADAPQDVYEYIYEKNGEKKSFTPETAPANDSTWTFAEAKLVKSGYVPPVTTFELYDKEGNNIAEEILSDEKGVFLLVSPKLEKANDKSIDEINNIYDYAVENQLKFYCLTSSDEQNIRSWINSTGAEYPFLMADDVTLKTMIRSNPGLVLLKSGTVLNKFHYNDLPSDGDINNLLSDNYNPSTEVRRKEKNAWILVILCFTLPLLLVWGYDKLRTKNKII